MLEKLLVELNTLEGVKGSLIAGRDGLVMADKTPDATNSEGAAAMASKLIGSDEAAAGELNLGEITQATVEGTNGKILLIAGKNAILMALTEPKINLGLIRVKMQRYIKEIEASI